MKRPRWIAATAAALIVGGAAAAVGMTMSSSDTHTPKGTTGTQPVGTTTTTSGSSAGTNKAASAVGISFASAKDLPSVPVAIQGAPRSVLYKDSSGNASLYVFVTGTDGSIWFLPGVDGHGQWTQLHGLRASSEPAVVSPQPGQLELFATAEADGQVQQRSFANGQWTQKWTPVGKVRLRGAPAALATSDGGIVLVGVSTDRNLMSTSTASGNPAWTDWAPVPGVGDAGQGVALAANPSASGYTAYFARASDQAVMAVGYANGQWSAPKQTPLVGQPTAATAADGTSYVFVRGDRGSLRVMNGNGQAGAGGLDSAMPPGAAATADGKIAVITAASPTRLKVAYSV